MAVQLGAPGDPETDESFIKNSFETEVSLVAIVNSWGLDTEWMISV